MEMLGFFKLDNRGPMYVGCTGGVLENGPENFPELNTPNTLLSSSAQGDHIVQIRAE